MKERIKELFEQAHIQPPATRSGQFAFTPPKTFSPEKFAELIVRECMQVLDPGEHQLIARFQARKMLEEHFGVE
jgi:hypothetical protein